MKRKLIAGVVFIIIIIIISQKLGINEKKLEDISNTKLENINEKVSVLASLENSNTIQELKEILDQEFEGEYKMIFDDYIAYYESRLWSELEHVNELMVDEKIQNDLVDAFDFSKFKFNQINSITNIETKQLIESLFNVGYKIETVEGRYYMWIDYDFLYNYSDNVSIEVKNYFDLMRNDSILISYDNAMVMTSWLEIGNQVLMAEKILDDNLPESMMNRAKEYFVKIFRIYLLGLDYSPVFDYTSKDISGDDILESYNKISENGGVYIQHVMNEYLRVLETENFKGTDRVKKLINTLLEETEKKISIEWLFKEKDFQYLNYFNEGETRYTEEMIKLFNAYNASTKLSEVLDIDNYKEEWLYKSTDQFYEGDINNDGFNDYILLYNNRGSNHTSGINIIFETDNGELTEISYPDNLNITKVMSNQFRLFSFNDEVYIEVFGENTYKYYLWKGERLTQIFNEDILVDNTHLLDDNFLEEEIVNEYNIEKKIR